MIAKVDEIDAGRNKANGVCIIITRNSRGYILLSIVGNSWNTGYPRTSASRYKSRSLERKMQILNAIPLQNVGHILTT